jgi:hypothetical protein
MFWALTTHDVVNGETDMRPEYISLNRQVHRMMESITSFEALVSLMDQEEVAALLVGYQAWRDRNLGGYDAYEITFGLQVIRYLKAELQDRIDNP